MKCTIKWFASLAGALGVGMGLPALAQVNPNPTIFQEPPYSSQPQVRRLEVSVPTGTESMTIKKVLDLSSSFEMFNALLPVVGLSTSDLGPTLDASGNYTVFAPTDEAFAALPEGTIARLVRPENRDLLIEILSYHVVPRNIPSTSITTDSLRSIRNNPLTIQVGSPTSVTVNGAQVIRPDIRARNGVIHAIDRVILPPDIMSRLTVGNSTQVSGTVEPLNSVTGQNYPLTNPLSNGNNNMVNPALPGGSQLLR